MNDIIPTVAVLVFRNSEVLLVRHKEGASHLTGGYGLPSGRIEENENEKEAAIRELGEETGLEVAPENLTEYPDNLYFASIPRKGGKVENFSWRVFIVRQFSGRLKESSETAPEWIDIGKVGDLTLLPNVYRAVQDGLKFIQK